MGEHKIPKPTPPPPERPGMALFNLRSAVDGARVVWNTLDDETRAYMSDLRKVVEWVDELEKATDPFAAVVPLIDPAVTDDTALFVSGLTEDHSIPAGAFRRLAPAIAARAVSAKA